MSMSDIKTTWQPVKPWVAPVVEEICTTRRIYFVWGKSSGTSGEHPLGRALDFSVLEYGKGVSNPGPARSALGTDIANYLWTNRARLNVWYVIWNRRIISTNPDSYAFNRWVPYNGKSPHTDHVHVSFEASGVYKPPPMPQPIIDELEESDAMHQLVRISNKHSIYAVTLKGVQHVKNPVHLKYLQLAGTVTKDIRVITQAEFDQLNEKE